MRSAEDERQTFYYYFNYELCGQLKKRENNIHTQRNIAVSPVLPTQMNSFENSKTKMKRTKQKKME